MIAMTGPTVTLGTRGDGPIVRAWPRTGLPSTLAAHSDSGTDRV
jgi:hypothetical protein